MRPVRDHNLWAAFARNPDNALVMSAKRRVARVLCSRPSGHIINGLFSGRIPAAGTRIDTRSPSVGNPTRAQVLFGIYEGAERRLLKQHLRPASTIVELGTSLGLLSGIAAQKLGGKVRLVGVEAHQELLSLAERNIRSLAPSAEVTLLHGAIDYQRASGQMVPFWITEEHTGASATRRRGEPSFEAPSVTLSSVIQEQGISEDFVLLADIEGAEAALLLRDGEALRRCSQLLIELHPAHADGRDWTPMELAHVIEGLGFTRIASYGNSYFFVRDSE